MDPRDLTESEFEDLSAFMDGELPPETAEEVRRREPAEIVERLRQQMAELQAEVRGRGAP